MLTLSAPGIHYPDPTQLPGVVVDLCGFEGAFGSAAFVTCPRCRPCSTSRRCSSLVVGQYMRWPTADGCEAFLKNPTFHKRKTIFWIVVGLPITLMWPDSILWVAMMSLYANVESSFTTYLASLAQKKPKP